MTCMTLMLPDGKPSEDSVSMVNSVCCCPDMSLVSQPSALLAAVETVLSAIFTAPDELFLFRWVLMCLDRWSLRMKRLGHSGQENFFSPGDSSNGLEKHTVVEVEQYFTAARRTEFSPGMEV